MKDNTIKAEFNHCEDVMDIHLGTFTDWKGVGVLLGELRQDIDPLDAGDFEETVGTAKVKARATGRADEHVRLR